MKVIVNFFKKLFSKETTETPLVNPETGRLNLKYPAAPVEDYIIPVSNTAVIEVEEFKLEEEEKPIQVIIPAITPSDYIVPAMEAPVKKPRKKAAAKKAIATPKVKPKKKK